jgi:hypothetical protein
MWKLSLCCVGVRGTAACRYAWQNTKRIIPFYGKLANSNPIIYEYNLIIIKLFILKNCNFSER